MHSSECCHCFFPRCFKDVTFVIAVWLKTTSIFYRVLFEVLKANISLLSEFIVKGSLEDACCITFVRICASACSFLARRDECPESYCRTPGVGVRVRVHKNFNLAYNSWTTIGRAFLYFTCVFLVTRPFHGYENFWPSDLDLGVWPTYKKL